MAALAASALAGCGGSSAPAYPVGGTVIGLQGSGLVLQNNGGDDLTVSASGSFSFNTPLAQGAAYSVTVRTQPSGPAQTCSVSGGAGAMPAGAVNNLVVTCATPDTRPLRLSLQAALRSYVGQVTPYSVSEQQGIALESVTWYFDGVAGGFSTSGLAAYTRQVPAGTTVDVFRLQPWATPGAHTVRVMATASGGRSASATATVTVAATSPLAGAGGTNCALTATASVKCWGWNGSGLLGDGTVINRSSPVDMQGVSGAEGIVAGDDFTCALLSGGSVACWGSNASGQLGTTVDYPSIQNTTVHAVQGLTGMVGLAAYRYGACALKGDGTVWCWGDNSRGQLGVAPGTLPQSPTATQIGGLSGVLTIAAGGASGYSVCALKADRSVACWGNNEVGELGNGTATAYETAPQTVVTAAGGPLGNVLAIRSGGANTCAIVSDGPAAMFCWGRVVGGTQIDFHQATSFAASGVLAMASGEFNLCTLGADGVYRCMGDDSFAQATGSGMAGPPVAALGPVTGLQGNSLPVAFGVMNTVQCALLADGSAACIGRGNTGGVGQGTFTDALTAARVAVPAGTFWTPQ